MLYSWLHLNFHHQRGALRYPLHHYHNSNCPVYPNNHSPLLSICMNSQMRCGISDRMSTSDWIMYSGIRYPFYTYIRRPNYSKWDRGMHTPFKAHAWVSVNQPHYHPHACFTPGGRVSRYLLSLRLSGPRYERGSRVLLFARSAGIFSSDPTKCTIFIVTKIKQRLTCGAWPCEEKTYLTEVVPCQGMSNKQRSGLSVVHHNASDNYCRLPRLFRYFAVRYWGVDTEKIR